MKPNLSRHPLGVIHGRFQVLHNDHLRYLLAGKCRCEHLVVGVTNPDPLLTRNEAEDSNRDAPLANPLTYYERQIMVTAALQGACVPRECFTVVPLPINIPELYRHYVPLDAVFFLTIYDDWGRAKLKRFQELGLHTEVLWEKPLSEKGLSACQVRQAMIRGDSWREMVSPAVAKLVQAWNVEERLRSTASDTSCYSCPGQ